MMTLTSWRLALCCLLLVLPQALANNPGFKIRVNQQGLDYANRLATEALDRQLRSLSLPAFSGNSGGFNFNIHNVKVARMTTPHSQVTTTSGQGLQWRLSIKDLAMSADFRVSKDLWLFTLRESGTVNADFDDISLELLTSWGKDGNGKPTVSIARCSERLGNVRARISNTGLDWLYNLLIDIFSGSVRRTLEKQLCSQTQSLGSNQIRTMLSKLQMDFNILQEFVLDYSLFSAPVFSSNHLETNHKGVVYWAKDRRDPPFLPPALPLPGPPTRMVSVWMSEHVFNSMAHAAHVHNYTRFATSDLPVSAKSFLSTSCNLPDICLGILLPEVRRRFPGRTADVLLYTSQAPQLRITPGLASVTVTGSVDLRVASTNLVSLGVEVITKLNASMAGDKLLVGIEAFNPKVTVKTAIPGLPAAQLQDVVDKLLSNYMRPHLNRKRSLPNNPENYTCPWETCTSSTRCPERCWRKENIALSPKGKKSLPNNPEKWTKASNQLHNELERIEWVWLCERVVAVIPLH